MGMIYVAIAMSLAGPVKAVPSRLMNSFETPEDVAVLEAPGARIQAVADHATDGTRALRVEFLPADWPQVKMTAGQAPWDWRGFDGLALDITNPGTDAIKFGIRVDDDPRADGTLHCRQGGGTIEPGATATFVLRLGEKADPMTLGMRGLPQAPGMRNLTLLGAKGIDLSHIVAVQVFLSHPTTPTTLILDNVRLVAGPPSLDRIVDEFGQYAKADWPGKLKSVSDLATRLKNEKAELKSRPSLPDRDGYGGWTKGPTRKATGFFRAEKIDGKWWLLTPEGHLFLSFGMDCVSIIDATFITGREYMFSWLPDQDDPLARHFGYQRGVHSGPVKEGKAFNFLAANLERKFGRDYEKPWFDLALRRLPSWGFNTIGNWSDRRLYGNARVPYVVTATIGGDHARISSGSDYWGRMHDPFDPRFAQDAATAIRGAAARVKEDPWCIGYFVDNELSWGGADENGRCGLARGALAEGGDSFAKRAFLSRLKTRYAGMAGLNEAWGTQFAGWDALNAPFKPAGPMTEAMKADMAGFVYEFARQYFRVVRDQFRQVDPNHLYLGCRFAWRTPEAVKAAGEFCDVVSFNIYRPRVDAKEWRFLDELNKPCIIGEFHFGTLDRGMFHTGLVAARDQHARAEMYRDYVRSVADHPALVGCHWFQYVDEPLTGRTFDGENYNIGFVTVTDTPYPEMVEAARSVHAEVYGRRWSRGGI
jgi:hypothetical protein